MFEFIRLHSRVFMLVLVPLIVGSFVFVGVQGYTSLAEGGNAEVAEVGGLDITQTEWDTAYRNSVEQMRRQAPQIDVKMFDTPQARQQVLERLVSDRAIQLAAEKAHFAATDERLLRSYLTDPRFASVRNPDGSLNKVLLEAALAQQGLSVASFESRLRDELALRQVTTGVSGTSFAAFGSASQAFDAMFQQREVQLEQFDSTKYLTKVQPTQAEIESYYKDPSNASQFKSSERAQIEYVVLDLESVTQGLDVPEDDVRKEYEANAKRFTVPEERRASHILIKAGKTAAERAEAKAKAEALLAALKKDPASFGVVATKESQDAISAERGGDVEVFIGRGDTEPSYESALFALKPGELGGVVSTLEGFYIVRLDAVRGGEKRSFESVQTEIKNELLRKLAQQRFADASQEFSNLVYDQSDSLKPVAEKFKLAVQTATVASRKADPQGSGPLSSPKFVEALFSDEVLNDKRNTEAVSLKEGQLAAGRVVQYTPSALLPLAEVAAQVKEKLVSEQASAMARKEGEARLAQLRATPSAAFSGSVQTVSRAQAHGVPREVVEALMKAPAETLPVFEGISLGGQGYVVAKLTKVLSERDPMVADAKQMQSQYARAWGEAEERAYVETLKTRFKAKIKAPAEGAEKRSGETTKSNASN